LPFLELRIELFDLRSSLAVDRNDTAPPAIVIPEVDASRPVTLAADRGIDSAEFPLPLWAVLTAVIVTQMDERWMAAGKTKQSTR
jgi:hypothetical protein